MIKTTVIVWLILLPFCAGCSIVGNLDKLLTLKAVGDEQATMDKEVQSRDKKFEALVFAVKNNQMAAYPTSKEIIEAFGEPVYVRDGHWVYRYSVKFFDSEKVYLYFDPQGKLVRSQYEPAPLKKEASL